MNRKEYRLKKFGAPRTLEEMDRRLKDVGTQEGILFDLDRIERTPNTFDSHRLIWLSQKMGVQEGVVEGLFKAFFTQGRDIGDRGVLVDIGGQAGINRGRLEALLDGDAGAKEVRRDEQRARELGIDSVPFFVIGGKYAVAGARSPEVFLEAIEELTQSPPPRL
jgi:predicted DsbA family dithiol-disulfide isomerase